MRINQQAEHCSTFYGGFKRFGEPQVQKTASFCRTGRSPLKCTIRCTLVQLISTHVVSFMSVLFRYRQTRRPHHDLNTSLPISSRHSPPVPVLCLSLYIPYLAGNRPAPWRANPSAASWCLPSLTPTIFPPISDMLAHKINRVQRASTSGSNRWQQWLSM